MTQSLIDLLFDTSIFYVDWRMIVMWIVVAVLMYLAVYKEFEPLLLVPIAFGALLANLPTEGVVNKPAGEIISPVAGEVVKNFTKEGNKVFVPRVVKQIPANVADIIGKEKISFRDADKKVEEINAMLKDTKYADDASQAALKSMLDAAEKEASAAKNILQTAWHRIV